MKYFLILITLILGVMSSFGASPPMQFNTFTTNRYNNGRYDGGNTAISNFQYLDLPFIAAGANVTITVASGPSGKTNIISSSGTGGGGSTTTSFLAFTNPTPIIYIDDMNSDEDGYADIWLLLVLHQQRVINLLGMIDCTPTVITNRGVSTAQIAANWFNNSFVSYGQSTNSLYYTGPQIFGNLLANVYPSTIGWASNAPSATGSMRSLLANSSGGVVLVFNGQWDALYDLLISPADSISSLTGAQLVSNKVYKIVGAAGTYPTGSEFNFVTSQFNLTTTFNAVPPNVPVVFSDAVMGNQVSTVVYPWIQSIDSTSPLYLVYSNRVVRCACPFGREAWGQLAILYAASGTNWAGTTIFNESIGTNSFVGGNNTWHYGAYKDAYITNATSFVVLSNILNSLLITKSYVSAGPATVQNLSVGGSDAALVVGNTNLLVDAANGKVRAGAATLFDANNYTIASRLEIAGSRAVTNASNQDTMLQMTRPTTPNNSFSSAAAFALGSWSATTNGGFEPNSGLSLYIKNQATSINTNLSAFVRAMSWNYLGQSIAQGQFLLQPGSLSSLSMAWSNNPTTGIFEPLNNQFSFVVSSQEVVRISSVGMFFPRPFNLRWVPAFGSSSDVSIDSPGVGIIGINGSVIVSNALTVNGIASIDGTDFGLLGVTNTLNNAFGSTMRLNKSLNVSQDGSVLFGTNSAAPTVVIDGAGNISGNSFSSASGGTNQLGRTQFTNPAGTAGVWALNLDASNNVTTNAIPSGSGSQTPLTADVNAAGKSMTNGNNAIYTNKVSITGVKTADSGLAVGSFEIQPFAINNCWISENVYYNAGFKYRANGYGTLLYFTSGGFAVGNSSISGSAGGTWTGNFPLNIDSVGNVGLGGIPTSSTVVSANKLIVLTGGNASLVGTFSATNGFATYSTNIIFSANTLGYTNSLSSPGTGTGKNVIANVIGTSGNIEFWNRSGLLGSVICGTALYTNTIVASGNNIVVPVNCGFRISGGVGVTIQVLDQ